MVSDLQRAISHLGNQIKSDSIVYLEHASLEEFLDTGDIVRMTVRAGLFDFDVEDCLSQQLFFDLKRGHWIA